MCLFIYCRFQFYQLFCHSVTGLSRLLTCEIYVLSAYCLISKPMPFILFFCCFVMAVPFFQHWFLFSLNNAACCNSKAQKSHHRSFIFSHIKSKMDVLVGWLFSTCSSSSLWLPRFQHREKTVNNECLGVCYGPGC